MGWFWENSGNAYTPQSYSDGLYSQSHRKYWIETKKNLRIHYQGCRWAYTSSGNQGCREDESEDGTEYWYQMANCRRAQVVFSLYGSNGHTEQCHKKSFLDTFASQNGLVDFVSLLGQYDSSAPITYDDVYQLPECAESGDGYYLSVGCSSSGTFTIDKFSDKYCLRYVSTVDNLSTINSLMKKLSCYNCMTGSSDYYGGSSVSLCEWLLSESSSCSPLDSDVCTNPTNNILKKYSLNKYIDSDQSTRHGKYVAGTFLIVCSAFLLIGVLMMNRRINQDFGVLRRKLREKRRREYFESGESIGKTLSGELLDS